MPPITQTQLQQLEACFTLQLISPFERAFLDNFKARFALYGLKTNITPKQVAILNGLSERVCSNSKPVEPA